MKEYIEREALMRRIKEIHCAECDSYHGVRCRACWVDDTLDYIDSEPAADVAPVVHGRWIHYQDCGVTRCSHCGWSIEECWESKHCPECGARMELLPKLQSKNEFGGRKMRLIDDLQLTSRVAGCNYER